MHPFHPLCGRVYQLVTSGHTWGENRVQFEDDGGCMRSVPVSWTSTAARDPFVTVAGGRAFFRTVDLLRLVALVQQLRIELDAVKQITPQT
ncbi:MAG: DUF5372 family protein [Bacillota bacterium]|nr:DUF5372 family protein [Bacillota bacterium]